MKLAGRDIVCIGSADWATELPINQHQLMGRLAAGNNVLFVESLGLRRPQLAGRDLSRLWRRLQRGLRGARPAPDGLHVLSPLVLPLHSKQSVRKLNRWLLRFQVRRAARKLGMSEPILWAYVPQAEDADRCARPLARRLPLRRRRRRAERRRRRQLPRGRGTLRTPGGPGAGQAPALAERMRTLSDHVLYAPNVADTGTFATALEPGPVDAALEALPHPRLVFQGAIVATKLDVAADRRRRQAAPRVEHRPRRPPRRGRPHRRPLAPRPSAATSTWSAPAPPTTSPKSSAAPTSA